MLNKKDRVSPNWIRCLFHDSDMEGQNVCFVNLNANVLTPYSDLVNKCQKKTSCFWRKKRYKNLVFLNILC